MSSMMMKTAIILSVAGAAPAAERNMDTTSGDEVMLVTFDGKPGTTFNFIEEGIGSQKSSGTWSAAHGHGALDAAIYPEWESSNAGWPGLIRATADGNFLDASSAFGGALILQVRTTTPEYTGFHITLGTTEHWGHASYACGDELGPGGNRGCYKANFTVPPSADFVSVQIPFTSFSGSWLHGSGAQYKACAEDKSECLTAKTLAAIEQISIWAEGIAGKPNLQVKSISASPAKSQLVTKLVTTKTAIISSVAGAAPAGERNMDTTSGDEVMLVTFDGKPGTTFNFIEEGVPDGGWILGHQVSSGTWSVANGHGALDGAIYTEWNKGDIEAPNVGWPGLIRATADGNFLDASSAFGGALILQVRTTTPEYTGFHITLGTTESWRHASYACGGDLGPAANRGCYKASFTVPHSPDFVSIRIPFTSFSGSWLYGPGAQYKACGEDKKECLTAKTLAAIKQISIWAEGIAGKPNLQVKSISASPSTGPSPSPSPDPSPGPTRRRRRKTVEDTTASTLV